MPESFKPDVEEVNYFIAAVLITAAAFTAFSGNLTLRSTGLYLIAATLTLLIREVGQRTVAHLMKAETELHLSLKGSIITLIGSIAAIITQLPVILLFPIYNTYSVTKYEHWGRSIDAMWLKREHQIAIAGITALIISSIAAQLVLNSPQIAQSLLIFTIFQLLPFDYPKIPTGPLDGATILKQNGFKWTVLTTISLITLAITLI